MTTYTGTHIDDDFDAILQDDGTLDTVVSIVCRHCKWQWTERFSFEHAADYRASDGSLSDDGLAKLLEDPTLCCPNCENA